LVRHRLTPAHTEKKPPQRAPWVCQRLAPPTLRKD
jgi:hypothetical protein